MQEIALYEKLNDPVAAIERLGTMFAKSGMFGCDKSEQGQLLAMICLAERKSPVEIMRTYDLIGGKLRKKALAALAEFRQRGGKHRWLKTGDEPVAKEDDREAVGEFTFEGNSVTVKFTIAQARKAGAIFKDGSNWIKTPGNMLRARVASNAVAMLAPEIFAGGEDESEPAPVAPLNLGTAEPQTISATAQLAGRGANVPEAATGTPVATSPAPVIDVQVEPAPVSRTSPPEDEATLAAMGLAPAKPISPVTQQQAAASQSAVAAGENLSAPPPAPVAASPAAPVPQQSAAEVTIPAHGGAELSPELVTRVENAIAEHAVAAGRWFMAQGWLKPGQGLENLSATHANRILKQRDSFLRAVTTGGAK